MNEIKEQAYIFTFGSDSPMTGKAVRIKGSFEETRRKMFDAYGSHWAFQYSEEEWEKMEKDPDRTWKMERVVDLYE